MPRDGVTSLCCHLSPAHVTPGCNQNQFLSTDPSILLSCFIFQLSPTLVEPPPTAWLHLAALQDSSQEAQHPSWPRALGEELTPHSQPEKAPSRNIPPVLPSQHQGELTSEQSSKGRPCTKDSPLRGSRAEDTRKGLAGMGSPIPMGRCP